MAWVALYTTVLRTCVTRARLIGFGAVSAVGIVVAAMLRGSFAFDPIERAASFVDWYGITLVAPIAALVFGTASLGDAIEDGTYVYLWLRPIGRWQISIAAFAATATVVVPAAVVPTVVGAGLLSSAPEVLIGATLASLAAALGYSAVFVLIGQVTQRALVWGAVYLLIFEQVVARGGEGLGFLSLHSHSVSLLSRAVDRDLPLGYFSGPTAVIMSVVIAGLALGWSIRRQARMDVA